MKSCVKTHDANGRTRSGLIHDIKIIALEKTNEDLLNLFSSLSEIYKDYPHNDDAVFFYNLIKNITLERLELGEKEHKQNLEESK